MMTAKGITGEKVLLRAICEDDLETLRGFVNDPEVMQFSNVYRPIHDIQQKRWYEAIVKSDDNVWFAIVAVDSQEEKLIGTCCLVEIDWVGRLAEFRIRIGEKATWGTGVGTDASRCLLYYAFSDLNLERLWLRVFASNERAIRMYQQLGFQVEGRLRRAAYVRGVAEDVILMGLLRAEWQAEGSFS